MRVPALVMAMLLVATPALPQAATPTPSQSPPLPQADDDAQPNGTTLVEISESLQQVFDLVKQPGFHPELLELLKIEAAQETAETEEEPRSGGFKWWYWVLIGVGVFVVVLAVTGAAVCGFQTSC